MMTLSKKLWLGIGFLALLSPLGLILPAHVKSGSAWGEWGAAEIQKMVGYVPPGLGKFAELWKAPIPDYAFPGGEEKGMPQLSLAYILSAVLGIVAVTGITLGIGKKLTQQKDLHVTAKK